MNTAVAYPAALIEQNDLFTTTVLSAAPETRIPACPDWSMRQLMRHVGRAHRWAAHIINTRADTSLDPRSVPNGRPPDDTDGTREWLLGGPEILLDAVDIIGGPNIEVATFDGPHPAQWWIRRLLHEVTVHRADAVLAVGQRYTLSPQIAADGVDEWLGRLAARTWLGDPPVEDANTVTLTASDIDASWTIIGQGNRLQLHRSATELPAGVQLSGSATDLFLALLRRRDVERSGCRMEGDPSAWTTFLARTPYAAPGTE